MIRNIRISDAKAIVDIYNYYILNTNITFEVDKLTEKDMQARIEHKIGKEPWIVYEEEGKVLGYAYIGEWRSRAAFNNTKEVSIYMDINSSGKGIGTKLMSKLIGLSKEKGVHTLVSAISIPNNASISLHKKFLFEKVGCFKQVGYKNNEWIDMDFWQLELY